MSSHAGAAAVVALGLALSACGGIPIWPAPSESPAPSASVAKGMPESAPTASASVPTTPVSTRSGVAVVAIGPITFGVDDAGAQKLSEGRDLVTATRALAKQLYGVPRLRPHADEATVNVLAGAPLDAGAPKELGEIGELRRALTSDLESVAARALLESLGRKVDVEGLVMVGATPGGGTTARLVRVVVAPDGGISTKLEGALFAATEGAPATAGEGPSYTWNATSIASLLGPAPTSLAAPPPGGSKSAAAPLGPRRDARPPGKTIGSSAKSKPKDGKDDKTIFQSPWFWVAAGAVAAIGVTALVVSQTVDTHTGSVHLEGKVLP